MATTKRRKGARPDVAQTITDQVIAALEAGTVPWQRPWHDFGLQRNLSSGRPYRGINQFLTQLRQQTRGFDTPWWLTYRAAEKAGGQVRKGERGTLVCFWKKSLVKDEDDPEGPKKPIWWVKGYTVFNLDQVDGIEAPDADEERLDFDPIASAEAICDGYPSAPSVAHSPGGAWYRPATDEIHMPPREAFHSETAYYATRFHEMVHSTGHTSRLDRPLRPRSDEEAYSNEELIAELGAAMLCAEASIDPAIDQRAGYIASWLKALRNDKTLVLQAAGKAQRAADHILGVSFTDDAPVHGDDDQTGRASAPALSS